mmetsp:Transcript_132410/g.330190  ORF Transcript_132410/g.330190 Transcript_132410/m.330190 type:complete len:200 (-) Transcript_132410:279-878(-)
MCSCKGQPPPARREGEGRPGAAAGQRSPQRVALKGQLGDGRGRPRSRTRGAGRSPPRCGPRAWWTSRHGRLGTGKPSAAGELRAGELHACELHAVELHAGELHASHGRGLGPAPHRSSAAGGRPIGSAAWLGARGGDGHGREPVHRPRSVWCGSILRPPQPRLRAWPHLPSRHVGPDSSSTRSAEVVRPCPIYRRIREL